MKECPKRCLYCIFVQNNPYDTQWECYNPLCAVMDTRNEGSCDFHMRWNELMEYYRARRMLASSNPPTWTRATPCRFVDDNGYCNCEHLVESIRRSMNITQLEHECLFVGLWGEARVICMGYEKKQQRFEVHNKSDATLIGVFDSYERAEKFIKERIEIVEVE